MKSEHDWVEAELQKLREVAKSQFSDVRYTEGMHQRIRQVVFKSKPTSGTRRAWGHIRGRTMTAIGTILATACVLLFVVFSSLNPNGNRIGNGIGPNQLGSVDWKTGFTPVPNQLIADYFQGIDHIHFGIGQFTPSGESISSVDIELTPAQQKELETAMSQATYKVTNERPEPASFIYTIGFSKKNMSVDGSFSQAGALSLPGDPQLEQANQGNVFAPNPALEHFISTQLLPQLVQKLQDDGKVMGVDVQHVATAFVKNLGMPADAFQYCIPTILFTGRDNFKTLMEESNSAHGDQYALDSVHYDKSGKSAIVTFSRGTLFWKKTLQVRLDNIGGDWLVTQVGRSLDFVQYSGSPPLTGGPVLGNHQAVIIGNYGPANLVVKATNIPYTDVAISSLLKQADVVVYEQTADHPLVDSPELRNLVSNLQKRHGALVVAGDGAEPLCASTVMTTIGMGKLAANDTTHAAYILVSFLDEGKVRYGGTAASSKSVGGINFESLAHGINQAALYLDTDWTNS